VDVTEVRRIVVNYRDGAHEVFAAGTSKLYIEQQAHLCIIKRIGKETQWTAIPMSFVRSIHSRTGDGDV